jgi:DNA adenine methylase
MAELIQPLKWHGGKHYLRKWIIGLMPPHLHYVEPFFGGGSVLLARDPNRDWMIDSRKFPAEERPMDAPEISEPWKLAGAVQGCSEVVNDRYGELTNFWRVLQNPENFETFRRRIQATPFSQVEFRQSKDFLDNLGESAVLSSDIRVEKAVNFFIRARQSRQGLMRDFATLSRNRTRSRINEQASAWLNVVEGLPDVHRRLQGVVILNEDACDVIRRQDGDLTLFYCDPPYLHETRSTTGEYSFEMSHHEHCQLLETLSQINGKFMLSGYPSPLYQDWQDRCGWNRHDFKIDNKAASGKTKEMKTECLWCNY